MQDTQVRGLRRMTSDQRLSGKPHQFPMMGGEDAVDNHDDFF